jgi:hypothetical protein
MGLVYIYIFTYAYYSGGCVVAVYASGMTSRYICVIQVGLKDGEYFIQGVRRLKP